MIHRSLPARANRSLTVAARKIQCVIDARPRFRVATVRGAVHHQLVGLYPSCFPDAKQIVSIKSCRVDNLSQTRWTYVYFSKTYTGAKLAMTSTCHVRLGQPVDSTP
jgi:hypothetical protein